MCKSLLIDEMNDHQHKTEELKEFFLETKKNARTLIETDLNDRTDDSSLNVKKLNKT